MLAETTKIDKKIKDCFDRIDCHLENDPKKVIDKIIKENHETAKKHAIKGSVFIIGLVKLWDLIF